MRRSAAPSQAYKAAKKPRFVPPTHGNTETLQTQFQMNNAGLKSDSAPGHPDSDAAVNPINNFQFSPDSDIKKGRTVSAILGLINKQTDVLTREPLTLSNPCNDDNQSSKTPLNCVDAKLDVEDLDLEKHLPLSSGYTDTANNNTDILAKENFESADVSMSSSSDGGVPLIKVIPRIRPSFKVPTTIQKKEKFPQSDGRTWMVRQGSCQGGGNQQDNYVKPSYFTVMWCKLSSKKHKKWEGDAVMVTKGRSVTLLDMEGKDIGRGTGYKTSELQTLEEGHTLKIGGKEIEVMGRLPEQEFTSGNCFKGIGTSVATMPEVPANAPSSAVSKGFSRPQKSNGAPYTVTKPMPTVVQPRHDPNAPNALVLPRPTAGQRWESNQCEQKLADVVVDPYLSQHLRPHQREGILFLYECVMGMKQYNGLGAILADEMGLGKTLQCIALIWTLLKQGPYGKPVIKKCLVITPGSLVKNWKKEFKMWLGTERIKVFAVGANCKVQEYVSSNLYPVMVISYEMFLRSFDQLKELTFDLIVCDEGHRLKNTNIKTTSLVHSLQVRRRVVLTGTPVQNDMQELFSIVDFCNPGILGTLTGFRRVYEEPILTSREPGASLSQLALGESRASELNRLTSMFILRRTSDINNKYLPPKVEMVLFCQLSNLQRSLYKQLLTSRTVQCCLSGSDSAAQLRCISALRKLCNHPAQLFSGAMLQENQYASSSALEQSELCKDLVDLYPEGFGTGHIQEKDSGKLHALQTLLERLHQRSPRERIVLVSNYTQTLNIFEQMCKRHDYQFLRLDGQTPTAKRQQLVEQFNNAYSSVFIFLLSSKAGGVGLNLIGASRLVLYDVDWNPANDLQAMARVWRDGQRNKVFIYRLLATGTIEEKMYQRQISKQGLSGVVVDAKVNTKMHFTAEELRDLFCLQEGTQCTTHDLLDCQCDEDGEGLNHSANHASGKSSAKNLCVDELLLWHHCPQPGMMLHTVDNAMPEGGLPGVTFAFWNEANKKEL